MQKTTRNERPLIPCTRIPCTRHRSPRNGHMRKNQSLTALNREKYARVWLLLGQIRSLVDYSRWSQHAQTTKPADVMHHTV